LAVAFCIPEIPVFTIRFVWGHIRPMSYDQPEEEKWWNTLNAEQQQTYKKLVISQTGIARLNSRLVKEEINAEGNGCAFMTIILVTSPWQGCTSCLDTESSLIDAIGS
jgi:hypothetical protein